MTERPVRYDWKPYRAHDPSTHPLVIPSAGSEWCYEVTRLWLDQHIVELAGDFRAAERPAFRWRALNRAVAIPNVIAWRILWLSAPWTPAQEAE